jgi:nucleoside-diphosphate-sugar epimerase
VLKRFAKLDVLYHVSTAYVCGLKLGSIPEGPFLVTEGFKNPYEESKYESEGLVRSSGLPAAIIRPSITIGDSRTGDSGSDIRMYYGYAFALLRAAMHAYGSAADYWNYWCDGHVDGHQAAPNLNARLVGCAETLKNIVTVDDVVAVCLAIRAKGAATNKTFNLVNPNNLTIGDALEVIQRILKVSGYCYDPSLTRATLRDEGVERAAFRYTRMYWPYALNTEPQWDTRNVDALSAARIGMTPALFESLMSRFVQTLAPSA